jgi:hypothetical protein
MTKGFLRAALLGTAAVLLSATASMAWDQHVTIYNESGSDVVYFYATNTGVDTWGRDRLGSNTVLWDGYNITLNITDNSGACSFDFRSVLANGEEVVAYDQDVCAISEYWIY